MSSGLLGFCTPALSAVDVTAALGGDALCVVIVVGAVFSTDWRCLEVGISLCQVEALASVWLFV